MKHKIVVLSMLIAYFLSNSVPVYASTVPSGNGTEEYPYLISNADELLWFSEQVNSGETDIDAVLTQNIDLIGTWTPIGTWDKIYTGTFDGNGKTISGINLYYDLETTTMRIGLFGYNDGIIKNITIKDSKFSASEAGAICTYNYKNGRIENCTNYAEVAGLYAGGICVYNLGNIIDSTNHGYVYGLGEVYGMVGDEEVLRSEMAGGICANSRGNITSCINYGNVFMPEYYNPGNAGGISASTDGGTILLCKNHGEVLSAGNAGGIVYYLNNTTIDRCINYEAISAGKEFAGGIAGVVFDSTLSNSINYGSVGGNSDCGGIAGYLSSPADGCLNFGKVSGLSKAGGVAATYENNGKSRASYSMNGLVSVADVNAQQTDVYVNIEEAFLKLPETAWLMNTANGEKENCGVWAKGAVFADEEKKAVFRAEISGKDSGIIYTNSKGAFEGLKDTFVYVKENNDLIDVNTVVISDVKLIAKDYIITDISFFDENGEKPYEIPLGNIYAKVTVVAPESGIDLQVILAEYEHDLFSEADICKKTVRGTDTFTTYVQVDGEDIYGDGSWIITWNTNLKIFVWDSNLCPEYEAVGYYD